MSRRVLGCQLDAELPSEECYSEICSFLDTWQVTEIEAQAIWEISYCRQHHISTRDLTKKLPKEFGSVNVDSLVKKLIHDGFVKFYESKKDVDCVRCTSLGRDVAYLINEQCYSGKLKHLASLRSKHGEQYLLCYDPQGFKVGETRIALGPKGEKILTGIQSKSRSDTPFRDASDKKPVYEIKLNGRTTCPRCNTKIPVEYCFNPASCYRDFFQVLCNECKLKFMIRHALDRFYYVNQADD